MIYFKHLPVVKLVKLISVYLFDIWTPKSGPNMWCVYHFDLEMCFAPQRCALFRHRNFQKWSRNGVLCAF